MTLSSPITVLDPLNGEVDYVYRTDSFTDYEFTSTYVAHVVDYDQRNEHSWAVHEWRQAVYGTLNNHNDPLRAGLESAFTIMDDGTTVDHQVTYTYVATYLVQAQHVYTRADAEGRTTSVVTIDPAGLGYGSDVGSYKAYQWLEYDPESGALIYSYEEPQGNRGESGFTATESKAFVAGTGALDYHYVTRADGTSVADDYDPVTGLVDFRIEGWADGRMVASDFDATTGLLDYVYAVWGDGHWLAQDYDSQGRLDFQIEQWADGRMVATDYDADGSQPWDRYIVDYAPGGGINSVSVF